MSCDQCAAAIINGVFCHETGCPNDYRECAECGSAYDGPDGRQAAYECCAPVMHSDDPTREED